MGCALLAMDHRLLAVQIVGGGIGTVVGRQCQREARPAVGALVCQGAFVNGCHLVGGIESDAHAALTG